LLNFDLDPCAIGWNGSEVFMLPRAARALETGYSVFTTDLIHGHYLSTRRATQEIRVFKYAERGYGLLFTSDVLKSSDVDFSNRSPHRLPYAPYRGNSKWKQIHKDVPNVSHLTGKKAFKKIQWNANDQVQRLYFGKSEGYDYIEDLRTKVKEVGLRVGDSEEGSDRYYDAQNNSITIPNAFFYQVSGTQQGAGQPGGHSGLKTAENFLRMCALWKLDKKGEIHSDIRTFQAYDTSYGSNAYADMPRYDWNPSFEAKTLCRDMEGHNSQLFYAVRRSIETYLHRPPTYVGYFNRRFRRFMGNSNFQDAMEKQITLPLWVPLELERYIETIAAKTSQKILIHATNRMHAIHGRTETEDWNLRIWIISHETMWAHSISREIDEIFEVLWAIFYFSWDIGRTGPGISLAQPVHERERVALQYISALLERRPILDEGLTEEQIARKRWNDWLMDAPQQLKRRYRSLVDGYVHPLYSEMKYGIHPPESFFWGEEDQMDDKGVWRDWDDAKEEEITIMQTGKRKREGSPDAM
jgi:hypothetical protein